MTPFLSLLSVALLAASSLFAADAAPKLTTVTPDTGKAGDQFSIAGENLTKASVAEVYLTDGKNDSKCDIVDQQAAAIKIKSPGSIKPGRYTVMVLTGDKSRFIEQPVKLTIQ